MFNIGIYKEGVQFAVTNYDDTTQAFSGYVDSKLFNL